MLLLLFVTVDVYGSNYSFCVKDSGFQRILLLSAFVDNLQSFETLDSKQNNITSLTDKDITSLNYFRIFRVKSNSSSQIEGYVFIIEDSGIGSIVVPIRKTNVKQEDKVKIDRFILSSVSGIISHVKGPQQGRVSVMVSKEFIELFLQASKEEDRISIPRDNDNYVLRTVNINLNYNYTDYSFEQISSVSLECENLVDNLVFSDEYDLEEKLLQIKSISFDFGKLVDILQKRYEGGSLFPHSLNGKFRPSLLDYIQAAFISMEHEKLVFYGFLREKQFKIDHIYSLLYNRYLKNQDVKSIHSGFAILLFLLDFFRTDELETMKSLVVEDDFISKVVFAKIDIEEKEKLINRLLVGRNKGSEKIVYKLIEAYLNLDFDHQITEEEKAMISTLIWDLGSYPNLSPDFLARLKFMVFESKRANLLGIDVTRQIFEVQKVKKCSLKFSVPS